MDSQNRSLEFAMLLTAPAAIALAVVPSPIVQVLFERGAYGPSDTHATSAAVMIFALGLPAFVLIKVFSPAFFAREDTRTPMRFAAISLTANTLGSIGLFFLFRDIGIMPHLGIAVATTLGGWLNALLLWWGLARNGNFAIDARARRNLPLIVLASLIMGAELIAAAIWLEPWFGAGNPLLVRAGALATLVASGGAVFFGSAYLLGAFSVGTLKGAVRRQQ